ncbi:isocitrate lyase/phosphoenolpyruvate mutase family protein [Evansella sp. LMS18]|uniref:isocitrate lyase/PEP mutase family protein n=1 Tax=Evansella sp. LMS18 TaxID=2924033 RepID=UPI0020D04FDC|nr:isocitrate lyase/phosphoenolpyruvate mutase family protein [Evansella sp. LMS18]UTR10203.1 isocitrate lyase/phosphoenolpyruvate mutase family protein [Evansella sp. LMS18]
MTLKTYFERYHQFQQMHHQGHPFVLPNAWDVISAKAFEKSGFKAVGTTSAGIALAHGYQDGEKIPIERVIYMLERIVSAVDIPVSADIEAGYGKTATEVLETIRQIIDAGIVGINLEDGISFEGNPLSDIHIHQEKIRAIKDLSASLSKPLFVNARTDIYWLNIGEEEDRFELAIERVKAYEKAGADCIFVPGLTNRTEIEKLRKEITRPINLLVSPDLPDLKELSRIGIDRVSTGSAPFRSAISMIKKMSDDLQKHDSFQLMTEGVLSYQEVMDMLLEK